MQPTKDVLRRQDDGIKIDPGIVVLRNLSKTSMNHCWPCL